MKKFKAPKDINGKPYWVPVVVKNKDVLVSFLNGVHSVLAAFELSSKDIDLMFGSERFNDILPDGKRVCEMNDKQILAYIKETTNKEPYINHIENDDEILKDYFLSVECTCGMFYGFNNSLEIPDKDLECDLCGKKIILYTKKDDSDFIYDGSTKIDLLTSTDPAILENVDNILNDKQENKNVEDLSKNFEKILVGIIENENLEHGTFTNKEPLDNTRQIRELNFELNKKIARTEVVDRLLKLDSINIDRRKQLNDELTKLKKSITELVKKIDDLSK